VRGRGLKPADDTQQRPPRILVVVDDDNVRWLVAAYLEREGYEILQAGDGPEGLACAQRERPDLLILDVMLPGLSGLDIAATVKSSRDVPILMLTSKDEEQDILAGFDSGADDYLAKPFSPKVLVARVRAILRRAGMASAPDADRVVCGELVIDVKTRLVTVRGRDVELTSTEFDLLHVFMEHPGWVYTREQLLEATTGYSHLGDSRAIDAHVANLRKKVEDDPADPKRLVTVRGVGYRLQVG
jgi:two-component system alkaline phosphatase synthesis response regulator PhoP